MTTEMESGEERRIQRLRKTFHSLATRIPRISLHHVDSVFPALQEFNVSYSFAINIGGIIKRNTVNSFIRRKGSLNLKNTLFG